MANEKNMAQEFKETYNELMVDMKHMMVDSIDEEFVDKSTVQMYMTAIKLMKLFGDLGVMQIELLEKQTELVNKQLKAEAKRS